MVVDWTLLDITKPHDQAFVFIREKHRLVAGRNLHLLETTWWNFSSDDHRLVHPSVVALADMYSQVPEIFEFVEHVLVAIVYVNLDVRTV